MISPSTDFPRVSRLPPYVFNITSELKMAARRRGDDIVDFGMGNPDGPTPPHIVAKLIETVQRPDTHGYSVSKGIPRLRRAITNWYKTRYDVDLDPESEAIATIGSKEGIAHLARRLRAGAVPQLSDPYLWPCHCGGGYPASAAGARSRLFRRTGKGDSVAHSETQNADPEFSGEPHRAMRRSGFL
jgi:alanine-synthesizing transaminase